jgi:hypothetical protein
MTEELGPDEPLVGDLPETLGPNDLRNLNRALEALFNVLRHVQGDRNKRAAAVISLLATASFLRLFRPVTMEALHIPLSNLV